MSLRGIKQGRLFWKLWHIIFIEDGIKLKLFYISKKKTNLHISKKKTNLHMWVENQSHYKKWDYTVKYILCAPELTF